MALLTNTIITKDALAIVAEKSSLLPNITLDQAQNVGSGASPYVQIRKAVQLNGRVDSATWSGETLNEESVALAVSHIYGADFSFTDSELALTVEDFSNRYVKPAVARIVSNCEKAMFKDVVANAGATVIGTKSTALDDLFAANTALEERSAGSDRKYIGTPKLVEGIMKQGRGLFNDASELAKQYKDGMAGSIGGFDVFSSNRMPAGAVGAFTDATVAVGMTEGSDTITIAGITAGQLLKGQAFTVAGCYELNPDTKDSLGTLFVFRCVEDSGSGSVKVQVKTYAGGTDARRNVSAIISASVAVDVLGGSTYILQGVAYDKAAIVAKFVELEKPKNTDIAETMTEENMSIRFARDWDIDSGAWKCRFDAQLGWAVAQPSHVVGILSTAS